MLVNCDFQYDKAETDNLELSNCVKCVVYNSKFHDKSTKGLFLKIRGPKTKDNVIEYNEFWNHTFSAENGGEPVRIGNSDVSGCWFNTLVAFNHFHDLKADVETVSIKSCGNTLYRNLHENNQSSFVIRHGFANKLIENVFRGSGGIRVYGKDNEIRGNYFQNNDSSKYPPLTISNGNIEKDPNEDKPNGGSSHAAYARVINNNITDNVFENCTNTVCVIWGRKNSIRPTRCKFRNNIVIAEQGSTKALEFSAGADIGDNEFASNIIYGNVDRGDLPEGVCQVETQKPQVKIPEVQVAGPTTLTL
jgi:poly(beta-D-mannuronate) lyase